MANIDAFKYVIDKLSNLVLKTNAKLIIAPEARGFIFGSAVAYNTGLGFIPARKKGKLPHKTISCEYQLEYGTDTIEIHEDAIPENESVVFLDDVLATGGTLKACKELCSKSNAKIESAIFLLELDFLGARAKEKNLLIESLLKI
ncbi:UNVERIFIED_CONTAM: hypothetical protein GTU68_035945 [Idotea baltica]|nr:hypothetical protein [Idotea baltica]